MRLPVLMESGTFAVEPQPWRPPWRTWEEIDPDEAAARGIYAPVHALSDGPPGAIVIAPGETRGTVLLPGLRDGGSCWGLSGADGPNMACATCGLPVASRIDDCSLWQAVWFGGRPGARPPAGGLGGAAASGGLPDGVLRDDPPVPRPGHLFRTDPDVFRHTLVRLPAVRSPWLREILDNITPHTRTRLFQPTRRGCPLPTSIRSAGHRGERPHGPLVARHTRRRGYHDRHHRRGGSSRDLGCRGGH